MKTIILSKIEEKKSEKRTKILDAAFNLFLTKGINATSIQDIVDKAGIGKGTFYLYFKDKYDLQNKLIIKKSHELFNEALANLNTNVIINFEDQIIFVIDYIIDKLASDKMLINFMQKDITKGIYNDITNAITSNKDIKNLFLKIFKNNNINLENAEITLFMIFELSASTIFSSITTNKPLEISKFKPYLYNTIRKILK